MFGHPSEDGVVGPQQAIDLVCWVLSLPCIYPINLDNPSLSISEFEQHGLIIQLTQATTNLPKNKLGQATPSSDVSSTDRGDGFPNGIQLFEELRITGSSANDLNIIVETGCYEVRIPQPARNRRQCSIQTIPFQNGFAPYQGCCQDDEVAISMSLRLSVLFHIPHSRARLLPACG